MGLQIQLYLCFIDYSKAFVKVKHSALFDILLRQNCDGKDLRVIRNLYREQEATIIDDDCSVHIPICRGARQGRSFSLDLFSIYSEMIQRNMKHHECVRVGGNNINNPSYENGTALIEDSEEKLQNFLTTVKSKMKTKNFN